MVSFLESRILEVKSIHASIESDNLIKEQMFKKADEMTPLFNVQ